MINRVSGTQDFLDLSAFLEVSQLLRDHLSRATFTEIATPIIEHTDLFKRSLGTETDVVSKEMYFVTSAHTPDDEKYNLCLRPEVTAATMRAYINNSIIAHPWSVFSIGPMFRHERQQKGRYRQFHQANIELINTSSIAQDARLITLLDRFFNDKLQMRNYALLLNFMGCSEDRQKYIALLRPFLEKNREIICETCIQRSTTNILRIFDCKQEACRTLYAKAPRITDHLCVACAGEWQQLQTDLQQLSVSFSHQPFLVRGLDYYEKTVFEFVSTDLGAQNAFCGGGRYHRIALEIGAEQDVPAVGAAIGIERLLMLVGEQVITSVIPKPLHIIVPLSAEQHAIALQIADLLHDEQFTVEPLLEGESLKSMLRQANKRGARTCILIGSNEQETGTVTVKQMITGAEQRIAQTELTDYLKKL